MTISVERLGVHVVRLTIDRPPVNAIDRATQRQLTVELDGCAADLDVRAVVLTGAGGSFCAGADLREEQALDRADAAAMLGDTGRLMTAIRRHRCPVIAAVDGAAHGGGLELALACDVRLASPAARFGAAGVNVGLIASFQTLSLAVGQSRARHMLLTGEPCDAARALDWGLVTEIVPDDELPARAVALAERIASRSPLSVEATKDCMNRAVDLSSGEAAALQVETFARLFATRDHAEALDAFFAKRPASYERR